MGFATATSPALVFVRCDVSLSHIVNRSEIGRGQVFFDSVPLLDEGRMAMKCWRALLVVASVAVPLSTNGPLGFAQSSADDQPSTHSESASSDTDALPILTTAPMPDDALRPDLPIKSLEVTLDLGNSGDDLDEPVALDFGVGFPFWLHPLGREAGAAIPFGAVAQRSTATGRKLAAGSSATFQFALDRPPGNDTLDATRVLMRDLRVSDISRVGLLSAGASGWVLDGLSVTVNGKSLVSRKQLGLSARETQQQARSRLEEIRKQTDPLVVALFENLPQSTEAPSLVPSTYGDLFRLERQVQQGFPWFVDDEFVPRQLRRAKIQRVRVTLETFDHQLAETRHRVYFSVGGHKYLLDPIKAYNLEAESAQEFELDLDAGPLLAADLRGWKLGLLANPLIQHATPDRWHPRRLMVSIDGQTVYDSDQVELDRRSLAAVRLVPPIQLDRTGQPKQCKSSPRELFLWQAGHGAGLDFVHGGVIDLATDGPEAPVAETSIAALPSVVFAGSSAGVTPSFSPTLPTTIAPLPPDSSAAPDQSTSPVQPTSPDATAKVPSGPTLPGAPESTDATQLSPPSSGSGGSSISPGQGLVTPPPEGGLFPGEKQPQPPAGSFGSKAPGSPSSPNQPTQPGSSSGAYAPSVQPPSGTSTWGTDDLSASGSPFQVDEVRIVSGSKIGDTFVVAWQISGDESQIKSYDVSLRAVYPDKTSFLSKPLVHRNEISKEKRSVSLVLKTLPKQAHYLAAMVVAVTKDASQQTPHHQRIGPASVVFAAESSVPQQLLLMPQYEYSQPPTLMLGTGEVQTTREPRGTDRAVWVPDAAESHNAIEFAGAPSLELGDASRVRRRSEDAIRRVIGVGGSAIDRAPRILGEGTWRQQGDRGITNADFEKGPER